MTQQLRTLGDWTNVFFQRRSYDDDIVSKACISTIARHAGKLHANIVDASSGRKVPAQNQNQLREMLQLQPNSYHTVYDLQYRLASDTVSMGNAYASIKRAPDGTPIELWPLDYQSVEPREADGEVYLRFTFSDGSKKTLLYKDVLHIRWNFTSGDLISNDRSNLDDQLRLLNTLEQSFENAARNSGRIRGIVQINGTIDSKQWQNKAQLITAQMNNQDNGGIIAMDQVIQFHPVDSRPQAADHSQLDYIRDNIYKYFGCSEPIVAGTYNEQQWTAFYESTIEPLAIIMSQEFTRKLLTPEQRAAGLQIYFDTNRLAYSTLKDKSDFIAAVAPTGALTVNDIAEILGMSPQLTDDVRIQSLNFVDASIANRYQLQKNGKEAQTDDNKEN